MTTDNLGWLLPAWLLGAPLLLGLYELATIRSRRERIYGGSAHQRDTYAVPTDRGAGRAV
jgi:hypothetical protein